MRRRWYKTLLILTLVFCMVFQCGLSAVAAGTEKEQAAAIHAVNLKTEYLENPMGIDTESPVLSWEVDSPQRAQVQSAYQIQVTAADGTVVWDSGKVDSNETTGIAYGFNGGEALAPMQRYTWRVQIWDGPGRASGWSEEASFETGLDDEQWENAGWIGKAASVQQPEALNLETANWIWVLNGTDYKYVPAETRYFRRTIAADPNKTVSRVLLAFTADDYGAVYVNGSQAASIEGANVWRKGAAVDVTSLFTAGDNQIAAEITNSSKGYAGFIAKVILRYADGTSDLIVTDDSWKITLTPGEDWKLLEADDSDWETPDQVLPYGTDPWKKQVTLPEIEESDQKVFDPAPMLRKEFSAQGREIASARAYITGLGYYELTLNGKRVGDNVIDPLVTRYHQRYFYTTYDVTDLLTSSDNAIGVTLGRGYYATIGNGMNWQTNGWSRAPWADSPKLRMKLCIEFTDGESMEVVSDQSWKTHDSPTVFDEPYYGEVYDARLETENWDQPGFDDSSWEAVVPMSAPAGSVEPQAADANKVVGELRPVGITNPKEGVYVFDMGRVVTGWAELKVQGNAGDMVTIQYGETLTSEGTLNRKDFVNDWDVDGFVKQASSDYYILKGGAEETWQSRFTYKGYQYIQVSGYPGVPNLDSITGKVVNADLKTTGEFSCSNEMFNQIHEIGKATLLNNLHSYPSDTPVYENLGYLGDGHLTQEMGMYNFDMIRYYEKWANDIRDQSKSSGYMEQTAPMWDETKANAPEWSAAICLVPWQSYLISGNKRTLADNYDAMKTVFSYQKSQMTDNIATSMWGDHATVSGNRIIPIASTAYVYSMADILAQAAEVLGYPEDAAAYRQDAEAIKQAFHKKFYDEDQGFYCLNKGGAFYQTAQALPLALGMVPEECIPRVAYEFNARTSRIESGIFGIKYVFSTLTEAGYGDLAYKMVNTEEYPGFGYWLSKGATSMWEGWMEGTRSRDHHMFATIDDWFFETIAGLNYEGAGFSTSVIKPYAVGGLTSAQASIHTVRGKLSSSWTREGDAYALNVTIPANTTATVYVPAADAATVLESGAAASGAEGVSFLRMDNGFAVYSVGSGSYSFTSVYASPEPIGKPGEVKPEPYAIDELADFSNMFSSQDGLRTDTGNADKYFMGDATRICRSKLAEKEVVYYLSDDIRSIDLVTFTGKNSDWKKDFAFSVSSDNETYRPLEYQNATREGSSSWVRVTYAFDQIPEGMRFFKIIFRPMTGNAWEPQLAKLTVDCANENPQFLTVDKRALQAAYDEAARIDLGHYSAQSADAVRRALAETESVLKNSAATQQMVSDALSALQTALSGLSVDTTALLGLIAEAEQIDPAIYTEQSYHALQVALQAARDLLGSEPTQPEIDGATAELQQALDHLEEKPAVDADKTILNRVLAYAQALKDSGEYDQAIDSVQASFALALSHAASVSIDPSATQQQVDEAWTALMTEIHKLGFVRGDKTSLDQLIAISEGYLAQIDRYTPSTAQPFTAALEAAKGVSGDGDAMQEDVERAENNLLEAMATLRYKADKSILEAILTEASGVDPAQYTPESVLSFHRAADAAGVVFSDSEATQQKVNAAADNLKEAMRLLKPIRSTGQDAAVQGDPASATGRGSAKTGETLPVALAASLLGLAAASFVLGRKRN